MARITVEDCLDKVDNRFQLVLIAAKRARDLSVHNAHTELEWENDKATVLALREVAAGLVDASILRKQAVAAAALNTHPDMQQPMAQPEPNAAPASPDADEEDFNS